MMRPEVHPVGGQPASARPPAAVTAARVMLVLGAVLLVLIAYAVYMDAGQTSEAWGRASVYGVPALLMLVLAAMLGRGRQGARWLAVVAGALMLFFGVGDLGQGRLLDGLLLTLFGVGVIANVNRRTARDWFRRSPGVP